MPFYDYELISLRGQYSSHDSSVLKRILVMETVQTQLKRRILLLVELHGLVMSLDIHGLI